MTFIANAVLGHFAQAAMGGLSDNQPNFHGRTVRPLGHWSSTLLWVTTALCVAGCVVAALATAMPMFVEMTAILMPVFSVTLGLIGASCAIGAYYISQFVPEYAFEENVREFQAVVTQYEQQVHGLQHQTQELQHRLEELDAINKEFDTTTTTLKEENERIKLTIGQFDEGSVDLAKRNVELQVRVVEFTKLFDEHENQIGEYESANKELKEQSLLLANELANAKSGMADFVKKMEELNATKESLAKHIGILQVELETQRSIKKATDEEIEGLRLEIIDVLKKLKASFLILSA